jgi:hypothetical protein
MRALILPALVVVALSACGGPDLVPTSQANISLIATPQDPMVVRAAIIRALGERDFAVTGEEPGQIGAFWDHDEETIRVSIVYDGKHYDIHYVQATGFDVVQQPGGELYIDETYGKIVKRLAHEIEEQLGEDTAPAMAGPAAPAGAPAETSGGPPASGTQPSAPSWQQFVPQIPTPHVPAGALPAPPAVNIQQSHTHKEQTQSLHCCINGAYFECATQQAFESCLTDGGASCARVPSKDGGC